MFKLPIHVAFDINGNLFDDKAANPTKEEN